jgi:hypothetical protein
MLSTKLRYRGLSYALQTFLNFRASSTYSAEIRGENTTSLYLPLPGGNMIKGGLVSL